MPRHAESPHEQGSVFRILAVCTGNICRSPQVEQLLRVRLPLAIPGADATTVQVASAGTMALDGDTMEPRAAAEAVRLGIDDATAHRARALTAAQIEASDLVIALAHEHRSAAVRAVPRANHRTFTLIELTRVVEMLAADDAPRGVEPLGDDGVAAFLRRVVTAAAAARGLLPLAATKHIDIDDPYGRSHAAYRRSADALAEHVDRLAAALAALATQ
ncbi:arsenate reductase/protein-tyrosine-phosphatase family protein [Agrococcus baldri]|uniref:protein-tyrosine-phosphatase n=1 Tax=Agrococcus baldri TaxID=153730 RepID=A0AA87RAV5_9MICO|nr:low molecular weight phosphatase family protein [Agrococcus baldri]GEK79699.1 low molecular weight phosphatase family protein [Agrococcus baldri]